MTSFPLAACVGALLAMFARGAPAAPYTPKSDDEVIETLPAGADAAPERALRTLAARDRGNLDLALRLADLYIAQARAASDPRPLGRAEAVLAPWWNAEAPPVPVLVARARIEQSNHRFAEARADLERALAAEPNRAQAWLTLATVRQVTGDLAGAAESCARLAALADALVAATCRASVDGVSGRAADAYAALDRALAAAPRAPLGVRMWATTLQAEIAERLGRAHDAERLYRASLALDPRDAYALAAYADFLIDAGRESDVMELIARDTPVDTLLLRYAQAAARLGADDAASAADTLAQRFAALRARGERVHLREEARFALEIRRVPDEALELALANWRVQKEPLDARIALEAALAAQRPGAAREVLDWIDATRLEGARIATLAREARTR